MLPPLFLQNKYTGKNFFPYENRRPPAYVNEWQQAQRSLTNETIFMTAIRRRVVAAFAVGSKPVHSCVTLKQIYMKQTFLRNTLRLLTGAFIVFSLSQCTKEAMNHDGEPTMESQRAMQSMNLKKEYRASLGALNNSGVHGTATLMLEGNMLTVTVEAMGLEAGKPHPQHIHGFTENNRNSTCPTSAFDTNGDGLIDLGESVPAYGPILLDLAPMPTADAMGNVRYTRSFTINSNLLPLQNRAIVLHGLTVNGQYVATLPVACGQVMAWQ